MKISARLITAASLAFAAAALIAPAARAEVRVAATSEIKLGPSPFAYSPGQCIGGVLFLAPMLSLPGDALWPDGPRDIVLTGVTLADPQSRVRDTVDGMKLLLFQGAPTGSYRDRADCQVAATDAAKLIGVLSIVFGNCANDRELVCAVAPIGGALPVAGVNLFALPIVVGTPAYGADASLHFKFEATVEQN